MHSHVGAWELDMPRFSDRDRDRLLHAPMPDLPPLAGRSSGLALPPAAGEGVVLSGAFPGLEVRSSRFCAFLILIRPHPGLPPLAGEGARGFGSFPDCRWRGGLRFWLFPASCTPIPAPAHGGRSSKFSASPGLQGKELEVLRFRRLPGKVYTKLMSSQPDYPARQCFVGDTPSPASGGGLGWGELLYPSACCTPAALCSQLEAMWGDSLVFWLVALLAGAELPADASGSVDGKLYA